MLGINRSFSVLFFAPGVVRGASFCRIEKKWKVVDCASAVIDPENPAKAWKSVLKSIRHGDGLLLLAGAVQDGLFFHFNSVELSAREQRDAVTMELTRHLLQKDELRVTEFTVSAADNTGMVDVAVYCFPEKSLEPVAARMTQSSCRADGFVYPLMAVEPGDPLIYMAELEPEFFFADGCWLPVEDKEELEKKTVDLWRPVIGGFLGLPSGEFDFEAMLPLLLCGRMVISGKLNRPQSVLSVLPEKLRPVRYRKHLILTAFLVILLAVSLFIRFTRTWGAEYSSYKSTVKEIQRLKRDTAKLKAQNKKASRELKEMQKVISTAVGDPDMLAKFALLSEALPGNVLVSNVRWHDAGVDMVLLCEDDKLDLPGIINGLGIWKIGQLQQRQTGDSAVATINLKLVPIESKSSSGVKK